ncbi:MAG: hypothetical protein ABGY11_08960, partial [Candidatus Thioglobus sp.]
VLSLVCVFLNLSTLSYSEGRQYLPSVSEELDLSEEELESAPRYEQNMPDRHSGSLHDLPGDGQKQPFGRFDQLRNLKIKSDFK